MISGQDEGKVFSSPEIVASIPPAPAQLTQSVRHLVGLVDKISAYVDDVVAGRREADTQIGILIADVMGSLMVRNSAASVWLSICLDE
jgi:hypothetical protein